MLVSTVASPSPRLATTSASSWSASRVGGVNVAQVRDLVGTMKREDAPLGLFVTLDEPSGPMKLEAAGAGTYWSELANREYPSVQIVTVKDLLEGRRPTLPLLVLPTFQQAERVQVAPGQEEMFGS